MRLTDNRENATLSLYNYVLTRHADDVPYTGSGISI